MKLVSKDAHVKNAHDALAQLTRCNRVIQDMVRIMESKRDD